MTEAGAPPPNQPHPHRIDRGIQKIKRYFADRLAARKQESPQDRASRRTATATVWIAILTVAILIVGGLQYLTFDRQLTVMQGQLDAMATDQRPWIRMNITNAGGLVIDDKGMFSFNYSYELANTGKGPAKNARIADMLFPSRQDLKPGQKPMIAREAMCQMAKEIRDMAPSIGIVFPGEKTATPTNKSFGNEAASRFKTSLGMDPDKPPFYFTPVLVGCVAYEDTFSKRTFLTWFSFEIRRHPSADKPSPLIEYGFPQTVAPDEINLSYSTLERENSGN